MRHERNFRPPFLDAAAVRRGAGGRSVYVDASCDFVALRDLKVAGVLVVAGTVLDKGGLTERRLRQMYQARLIALAPGSIPRAPPPRPPAVGRTDYRNPGRASPPENKSIRRAVPRRRAA